MPVSIDVLAMGSCFVHCSFFEFRFTRMAPQMLSLQRGKLVGTSDLTHFPHSFFSFFSNSFSPLDLGDVHALLGKKISWGAGNGIVSLWKKKFAEELGIFAECRVMGRPCHWLGMSLRRRLLTSSCRISSALFLCIIDIIITLVLLSIIVIIRMG